MSVAQSPLATNDSLIMAEFGGPRPATQSIRTLPHQTGYQPTLQQPTTTSFQAPNVSYRPTGVPSYQSPTGMTTYQPGDGAVYQSTTGTTFLPGTISSYGFPTQTFSTNGTTTGQAFGSTAQPAFQSGTTTAGLMTSGFPGYTPGVNATQGTGAPFYPAQAFNQTGHLPGIREGQTDGYADSMGQAFGDVPKKKNFVIKRHTAGCCGALNNGAFDKPNGAFGFLNCRGCCDREKTTYRKRGDDVSIEAPRKAKKKSC